MRSPRPGTSDLLLLAPAQDRASAVIAATAAMLVGTTYDAIAELLGRAVPPTYLSDERLYNKPVLAFFGE